MPNQIITSNSIYLDHAAATPLDEEVLAVMLPHLRENYGNPSSLHHLGRTAQKTLEEARKLIANTIDVSSSEIIFTGSGTESDNLAILGLARANRKYGNHVIVSAIEHKAVLAAAKILEQEGFRVTYLPVDEYGCISIKNLEDILTDQTILISIMYANNEIGTIQPIKEIVTCINTHYKNSNRPLIHTDACQAAGLLPIQPTKLGVDAMTINSSKIYGPKGIGLLYVKSGTDIAQLIVGGDQEHQLRAGTENIALAIGFATALKKAIDNTEINNQKMLSLQQHFLQELNRKLPNFILNGHIAKRLPNNVHICVPDIEGESILLMLDAEGIFAATGSACSSFDLEPSHVLTAIGRSEEIIHGSVRFSFGKNTTKNDLTYTAQALGKVVKKLLTITASSLKITSTTYAKHS